MLDLTFFVVVECGDGGAAADADGGRPATGEARIGVTDRGARKLAVVEVEGSRRRLRDEGLFGLPATGVSHLRQVR